MDVRVGTSGYAYKEWKRTYQPWKTAHVFFKHEDEAAGPLVAEKFAQRFSG